MNRPPTLITILKPRITVVVRQLSDQTTGGLVGFKGVRSLVFQPTSPPWDPDKPSDGLSALKACERLSCSLTYKREAFKEVSMNHEAGNELEEIVAVGSGREQEASLCKTHFAT